MNLMKVLKGLGEIESVVNEDVDANMQIDNIITLYSNLPIVERAGYPAQDVPIREYDSSHTTGSRYGVSCDVLSLFMERNNIKNIKQALNAIGEANNFSGEEITIEFPGNGTIATLIQEAKRETNMVLRNDKLQAINRMGKLLDGLDKSGIKTAKESDGVKKIAYSDSHIETKETTGLPENAGDDSKHKFRE